MSDNGNGQKIAAVAVLGALAGFVAGILFAPKSGKETRADIKNAAQKVVRRVHSEADRLLEEAKKLKSSLSARAKEELTKLEDRVNRARDRVARMASRAVDENDDADLESALDEATEAFDNLKKFLAKNTK